jgi:glutamyl-tRNA reductase
MIVVVGLSHRTAPVDVRERLAAGADALPAVLARLAARTELAEVLFLSTCNRVEVFALAPSSAGEEGVDAALRAIREELARHGGVRSGDDLARYLYDKRGEEAVEHVFRVAASLDSMVLGEPQILGQVKEAYEAAVAAGALKGMLARCVTRAFAVAKRVRTETAIGAGTVSISSVAVDLAGRIFGGLADHAVLLLGAGEMAEAAARSLGQGARALRICNRSFDRAAALARELNAAAVPWDGLDSELVHADIAVPRNVEPSVHGIDNVYVFNVDDLEKEVARSLQARQAERGAADKIVEEELARFLAWTRGLEVQPTVVAMRAKAHAVLFSELERSLAGRLKHLAEADRAALKQMLESAVGKLLHAPTSRLKERAADGEDARELAAAMRFLFDLQELGAASAQLEGAPADSESDERLPN